MDELGTLRATFGQTLAALSGLVERNRRTRDVFTTCGASATITIPLGVFGVHSDGVGDGAVGGLDAAQDLSVFVRHPSDRQTTREFDAFGPSVRGTGGANRGQQLFHG